ncbi:MAG: hypothetical protein AAGN35_11245 [Bacteroidota bacterium]
MQKTILPLLIVFFAFAACKETQTVVSDTPPEKPIWTPAALITKYEQGEVSRCNFNGQTVYFGQRNAPDGGAEIYDDKGRQIGVCYYSTNRVDAPCESAMGCEVIYRIKPNIWGKPGVKYNPKK